MDLGKVGNWFRGIVGESDEEKKKRLQAQKVTQPKLVQPTIPAAPKPQAPTIDVAKPGQVTLAQPKKPTLTLDTTPQSSTINGEKIIKPDANITAELDRLKQANLEASKKKIQQNEGFFSRIFNKSSIDSRAEQDARRKAVEQYQSVHGYNEDPTVKSYNIGTDIAGRVQSQADKNITEGTKEVIKKASEIPVLSDFTALGSGSANLFYNALGDKKLADEAHNNWSLATLGMSDEEISKLAPDQQDRLRKLQTALTAASPVLAGLDIASIGEISGATSGFINAAKEQAKGEARQQLVKETIAGAAKHVGKNAAIAGISAPVVAAPIQNYVQNGNPLDFTGYDPSQVPREAATAALWSALIPGGRKKPAVESVGAVKDVAKEGAVQQALRQLEVDPGLDLSAEQIKRLEENGITAVRQDPNDPYSASYSDGKITARDQESLSANINHELGHAIWQNQLTPEEKALFNGTGSASQQARGRAGYTPDDINSEDFSDYMNKALSGNINDVPETVRAVIAKYARVALQDPKVAEQAATKITQTEASRLKALLESNPNITKEQRKKAIDESKARASTLLDQLEKNRKSSEVALNVQDAENSVNTSKLAQQTAEAEAKSAAQTNPDPAQVVESTQPTAQNTEVNANNAYDGRTLTDYIDEQTRRLDDSKENPVSRFFRVAKEQTYDPLSELQRLDEKGALGNDSLVSLVKRITNPDRAVDVRVKAPIQLPNGFKSSVWDIIKKYGKADGEPARDFANYRMFKDELWRITEGGQRPALRANPQEMADFVARYEAQHPDAIQDNAVLREFALRNLKERADAGVDSQAIFEASAKNPYYSPRTRAVSNNKDLAMSHSGGFSTTSKSTAARTGADVAISPLDLYVTDARNTEIGILRNELGRNFFQRAESGQDGFRTDVDPYTAVAHRDARQAFDSSRQDLLDLRDLRDQLTTDKSLSKAELATITKKATAIEDQAVAKMRLALDKAATNPEDVLHDVAARDPEYAIQKKAIQEQKLPNLTPKERREQIKYDLKQLEQKYPDPKITTREELLQLAQSLNSGQFTPAQLAEQATTLRQQIPDLEQRLDAITGMGNQARQDVSDADKAASQAWQDLVDTTQHREDFNGNVWTFKVDGEAGRGTAPAGLAAEMSRLNEFAKPGSRANLLLRGTQAVGSATKAFWTGAFAPVWQTLNILKNAGLMVNNGRWFEALSPDSFEGFFRALVPVSPKTQQFINDLRSRGASYENITQSAAARRLTGDDIAARANLGTFLARNPVNTLKDLYHLTSAAFTHVANSQRNAVAWNAYQKAIDNGIPNEQALHLAVNSVNNVFGDLQRVSELAQAMEPLIPYSGATQAGVRALVNKAKTNPAEFAVKQAAIASAGVAFTLYSMSNAQEYYKDQIDKGYTTDLDNNFVIVLPGATRDADGNWNNVVKIPITPDFRPLNRAAWRTAYSVANGQGVPAGLVAGELFNEFTGDMANNIYDTRVAENAGTPLAGLFTGSPALNTGKILTGINPTTGNPLSDSDLSIQPRTQQAYDSTSNAAQSASELTGGALTPIQFDKLFGQFGSTGKALKEDTPGIGSFFNFKDAVYGGKGITDKQRETQQYFDNLDAVEKTIPADDKVTLKQFQSLHSKKTDPQGDNLMNSAVKAAQMMQYTGDGSFQVTPLFNAEKALDDLQRSQGQPGNPLFDLPAQELQKVLMYRSLKAANAAGQNYSKGGESAFTALGLDDKWYQDFRDKEDSYYKALNLEGDSGTRKSFSGKQEAQLSDEQRQLQNQYFALPAKSDARRAFLSANPWLKDYWASDNEFTDQERQALGFDSLNGDGVYDGNTGFGGGSGGTNSLTALTDFSNDVNGSNIRKIEAKKIPNEVAIFRGLFAGGGGGRTKPKLGASSSGR